MGKSILKQGVPLGNRSCFSLGRNGGLCGGKKNICNLSDPRTTARAGVLALSVDGAPMPQGEHVEPFPLPVDIEDEAVGAHPKLVRLDGSQARQEPAGVLRDLPQLGGDALPHRFVHLPELLGREIGELHPERQGLTPEG